MGAGQPPRPGTNSWAAYITAKTAAEADLRARDLDWTILRPGGLTDAPATGRIRLAPPPVPAGTVPRADVAAVIASLLTIPVPSTRRLNWSAETARSPRLCTPFLNHGARGSPADHAPQPPAVMKNVHRTVTWSPRPD